MNNKQIVRHKVLLESVLSHGNCGLSLILRLGFSFLLIVSSNTIPFKLRNGVVSPEFTALDMVDLC